MRVISRKALFLGFLLVMFAVTQAEVRGAVEFDVDYRGADIKNFKSEGLQDCYNNCRLQIGCVSFTMRKSDYRCWLKKQRNGERKILNKPNLVSYNLKSPGSLGCWQDSPNVHERAIHGGIRLTGSIAKCEEFARSHGWSVFAIQLGRQCFTASDAYETYKRYGSSNQCSNGLGGPWAQNVYQTDAVEYGVDYRGADIRNFKSEGLRDCYKKCRNQSGCVSFTMRKSNNHCWLKKQHNGEKKIFNKHDLVSFNLKSPVVVCPAGTYLPVDGAMCKTCEGDTISTGNATSCVPCAAREIANKKKTECVQKPPARVTEVFIEVPTSDLHFPGSNYPIPMDCGKPRNVYFKLKQGNVRCATHNPTWVTSRPQRGKVLIKEATGCHSLFDEDKPIDILVVTSGWFCVEKIGVKVGNVWKTWKKPRGYDNLGHVSFIPVGSSDISDMWYHPATTCNKPEAELINC